jgi:hypothetical protein
MTMLISILIALIIVGLVLYAVNHWLPIDGKIKQIINVVVIVLVIVWLLRTLAPSLGIP